MLAKLQYTQAVELLPSDARPLAQRGYAYASLGEKDKAMADFEAALKLNPNLPEAKAAQQLWNETTKTAKR